MKKTYMNTFFAGASWCKDTIGLACCTTIAITPKTPYVVKGTNFTMTKSGLDISARVKSVDHYVSPSKTVAWLENIVPSNTTLTDAIRRQSAMDVVAGLGGTVYDAQIGSHYTGASIGYIPQYSGTDLTMVYDFELYTNMTIPEVTIIEHPEDKPAASAELNGSYIKLLYMGTDYYEICLPTGSTVPPYNWYRFPYMWKIYNSDIYWSALGGSCEGLGPDPNNCNRYVGQVRKDGLGKLSAEDRRETYFSMRFDHPSPVRWGATQVRFILTNIRIQNCRGEILDDAVVRCIPSGAYVIDIKQ